MAGGEEVGGGGVNWLTRWRERREQRFWEQHDRDHRWDELAAYNDRVSKGIVHTPEYTERMRREQARFDAEQANATFAPWY